MPTISVKPKFDPILNKLRTEDTGSGIGPLSAILQEGNTTNGSDLIVNGIDLITSPSGENLNIQSGLGGADILIKAGTSSNPSDSADINIIGGISTTAFKGGDVNMVGGFSTSGNGGNACIKGGETLSGTKAGDVCLLGGNSLGGTAPGNVIISGGNSSTGIGNITLSGDSITLAGDRTIIDSDDLLINDPLFEINTNETSAGIASGYGGFIINRGSENLVSLGFREVDTQWVLTEDNITFYPILHDGNIADNTVIQTISGEIDSLSAQLIPHPIIKDTDIIPASSVKFVAALPTSGYRSAVWEVTLSNLISNNHLFLEMAGIHLSGGVIDDNMSKILGDKMNVDVEVAISGSEFGLNITNNEANDLTLQYIRHA